MKKQLLIILFFLCGQLLFAQYNGLFQKGNDLYGENNYEEAIGAYKKILEAGYESAEVYYNLGNSYFKSHKYTYAIWYYEKALKLAPDNEDVKANLELVKEMHLVDKIDTIPDFFLSTWVAKVRNLFSFEMWSYISLAAFICFLLGFAMFLFSGKIGIKKLGFAIGVLLLFISITSFAFTTKLRKEYLAQKDAIIFTPTVIIKSSPDEKGTDLFVLHEGIKVEVLGSENGWSEIKISSGNVGWLKDEDIKRI